jgi:DNA-nicking Smr family endonuclease
MARRLSAEERALWRKVIETVKPLNEVEAPEPLRPEEPEPPYSAPRKPVASRPRSVVRTKPGTTLDGTWDRRLGRGLVRPDSVLDLHGHNLGTAYDRLDQALEQAITVEARLLLLITGKPPADGRPAVRGAIRAAIGDWLAASRHAGDIAAVRNAHPRHGGAGALYIVFRRRRAPS